VRFPRSPAGRRPVGSSARELCSCFCVTIIPGATGVFGAAYLIPAVLLGAVFCAGLALVAAPHCANAALTFHFSLLYLALLFVAVALDAAIR
jgi:heme O synthase-like polyprenyltransferase